MKKKCTIRVRGIVQGVGFRPFVYRRAYHHHLEGSVCNDTEGVSIMVEGYDNKINALIEDIKSNHPPLAAIESIELLPGAGNSITGFSIVASEISEKRDTFIPPDTAVCPECLNEFFDMANRRYGYPFITCTNCGPRFSITRGLPYDRPGTTMAPFSMCPDCQQEYDNPLDRRFHTQPNACDTCGPHLSLRSRDGTLITKRPDSIAQKTIKLLKEGNIIAIKSTGGYLLAADAANDDTIDTLRRRKSRPFKPFALMAGNIETIESFLEVSPVERKLLLSRERPIVLLREKKPMVSPHIAPGLSYHGMMLPSMPFQYKLFSEESNLILVMTSGNVSDEPIIYRDADAFENLGIIADYFVTGDREISSPNDDSVLFAVDNGPAMIRRSRGFVPVPFFSKKIDRHILATGGDIKSCFALAKDTTIIMSQHLGDLATVSGNELYRDTVDHFSKLYDFRPEIAICDMHPGYFTTQYAIEREEQGLGRISVQHHHAHIASVLEEYSITGKVIGIALDGTGYGTDGTLWGSEFLIADTKSFIRAAHFSNFQLPGGESAIRDVWKIGTSLLYRRFGKKIPVMKKNKQTEQCLEILEKNINSPLTCSIGRIFDGIAAILGISSRISCEAEAAQLLEEAALKGQDNSKAPYAITYIEENDEIIFQTDVLTEYIVGLIQKGEDTASIAYAFHMALSEAVITGAVQLRERYGISTVVLSGGVFQNRLLLGTILEGLREKGFTVYIPRKVPFNDGCIALGQVAVAKVQIYDDDNF